MENKKKYVAFVRKLALLFPILTEICINKTEITAYNLFRNLHHKIHEPNRWHTIIQWHMTKVF